MTCTKVEYQNKSKLIIEDIREKLLSKQVQTGQRVATIANLARQHGMDRRAVSKAVDSLIKEGLVKKKHGIGLVVSKKSDLKLVEVVLPGLSEGSMWWGEVVRGVKSIAGEYNIDVLIRDAEADLQNDIDLVNQLPNSLAQAAVIISIHNKTFSQAIVTLANSGYPFVLIDEKTDYAEIDCITNDHYGAGYKVSENIVKLGHRKIGIVTSTHISTLRNALDGFRDAINDAGIAFNRKYLLDMTGENNLKYDKDVIDRLRDMLEKPNRPTAIYFPFAGYARYCLELIRSLGLRVPEDISIVGCNQDCRESALDIPISGMVANAFEIGQHAMRRLLVRFGETSVKLPHKSIFEFVWVQGQTLGPVNCPS